MASIRRLIVEISGNGTKQVRFRHRGLNLISVTLLYHSPNCNPAWIQLKMVVNCLTHP